MLYVTPTRLASFPLRPPPPCWNQQGEGGKLVAGGGCEPPTAAAGGVRAPDVARREFDIHRLLRSPHDVKGRKLLANIDNVVTT